MKFRGRQIACRRYLVRDKAQHLWWIFLEEIGFSSSSQT